MTPMLCLHSYTRTLCEKYVHVYAHVILCECCVTRSAIDYVFFFELVFHSIPWKTYFVLSTFLSKSRTHMIENSHAIACVCLFFRTHTTSTYNTYPNNTYLTRATRSHTARMTAFIFFFNDILRKMRLVYILCAVMMKKQEKVNRSIE